METLIETIRVAVQGDATDDAKQQGANACRTILTALEAKAGEPLVPASSDSAAPPSTSPSIEPQKVAAFIGALRNVPVDQLLDLAIARLRAALPAESTTPAVAPVRFQIVPVAQLAPRKGTP